MLLFFYVIPSAIDIPTENTFCSAVVLYLKMNASDKQGWVLF